MRKQDLHVVKVLTAQNEDLAFIYAFEVRVKYTVETDFETVVTYFDRQKAITACNARLDSGNIHSCYIAKIRIWL